MRGSSEKFTLEMLKMGEEARKSASILILASPKQKNDALNNMADEIINATPEILKANLKDIEKAESNDASTAMVDRLWLDENRIKAIADSVRMIAKLQDPVGQIITKWDRPNGLQIVRVRTPLGVIGIIYESRPNVTVDAGALCLKSGNATILRGGSDSFHSSRALHSALIKGLKAADLPENCIQLVTTTDRAAVGEMLSGLNGTIDVIIPRGGRSLIERVLADARVPVFAHLEGLCHIYVDASAKIDMAVEIVSNSKMRRTGICGAVETLLINRKKAQDFLPILENLKAKGCEIRGTEEVKKLFPDTALAIEADWATEYLDAIISIKLVDDVNDAIDHINRYSSHHTEAVIAEDQNVVETFFNGIDSAILLHNASTQFADGGEFGFGAEIGIATGKMQARGPIGVEQLTSFKYLVHGKGQTRP